MTIEAQADFYTLTQRLLLDARNQRDATKLRRAAIRIDSEQFLALPDDAQEGLLELYGQAMVATGALSP